MTCNSHLLERISSHEELAQGQHVSVLVLGRRIVHLNKQDWRQLALGANDVVQDLRDACEVLGGVMAKHIFKLPKKSIETTPVCQHSSQLRVEENL